MALSKGNTSRGIRSRSAVIRTLAHFSDYLRTSVKKSFIGSLFTSYKGTLPDGSVLKSPVIGKITTPVKRYIARQLDKSFVCYVFEKAKALILGCTLRFFGIVLFFFGIYSAVGYGIRAHLLDYPTDTDWVIWAAVVTLASMPLMLSDKSLSEALLTSKFGIWFISVLGFREESVTVDGRRGRTNIAFVIGLALGAVAFFATPMATVKIVFSVVAFIMIMCQPEIGVMLVFFELPWLTADSAVAFVLTLALAYGIKVLRGKRALHFEKIDVFAVLFMVVLALASFNADGSASFVYVWLTAGYFLVSFALRTEGWLKRCTTAAACSVVAVSLVLAAADIIPMANGLADFVPVVSESAVSLAASMLGDADAASQYLIILLPMLLGVFVSGASQSYGRPLRFALAIGLIAACYALLTNGMWLSMLLTISLILLIRNRHAVYLFAAVGASVPILYYIFPKAYFFLSNGLISASSIDDIGYSIGVWKGTAAMAGDYFFTGIGLGEGAWCAVYPNYAVEGFEDATHAHSLILGVLSSLGIVGTAVFLTALFLALRAGFTYLRRASAINENTDIDPRSGQAILYRQRKLAAAAPLCAMISAITVGITENIWANPRIYMLFWLIVGLSVAYAKCGETTIKREKEREASMISQDGSGATLDLTMAGNK